jgi:hypothetical protein
MCTPTLRRPSSSLFARFFGLWLADKHATIIAPERAGIIQCNLKPLSGTVQTHFDRRQGQGKQISNLAILQAIGIVQQEHCLLWIGQCGDVLIDAFSHLRLLNDHERRWLSLVDDWQVLNWRLCLTRSCSGALAQAIDADVRGDAIKPALQCCWIVEGCLLAIGPNESLLSKVLGLVRVMEKVASVSNETRAVRLTLKERR